MGRFVEVEERGVIFERSHLKARSEGAEEFLRLEFLAISQALHNLIKNTSYKVLFFRKRYFSKRSLSLPLEIPFTFDENSLLLKGGLTRRVSNPFFTFSHEMSWWI